MRDMDLPSRAVMEALMFGALRTALGPLPTVELTLERYILAICRCWHTTHHTPGLMERAAKGFGAIGDHHSALLAKQKAREETGHDILALKDLASLGLPADLPQTVAPANGIALVALFDRLASAPRPYGVFGYAFTLEAFAVLLTAEQIAATQRLVPRGLDITRCLRVHSAGDLKHVAAIVDHVADMDQAGREAVLGAIQETAPLIAAGFHDTAGLARLGAHLDHIGWTMPSLETAS